MKHILSFAALFALLAVGVNAQTVTVAQSGTPDFGTVQAAIDNFDPDPDGGTPNVIQITDAGVYDEIITIDVPVTIEGTGGSRPILALQTNPDADSGANDGLVMVIPTGTLNDITLRNLIFIPSLTDPPADDGLRTRGQNINLLIDNCVVTANDGSNNPVTTDGLTQVDLTGATPFGDDGAFLGATSAGAAGDGTVVTMVNTVISHNNNAGNNDGLVCSGSNEGAYIIQDGCVFSYNNRLGLQVNGSFTIDAENDHCLVLGNNGFAGVWGAGTGSGVATPVRNFNGLDVIGTTGTNNDVQGWGIEQQNGGDVPFNLSNAIIAQNAGQGLLIGSATTAGAVTIADATFSGNGGFSIETDPSSVCNITVTDAIFKGGTGIAHNGTGTFDITFSGLISQTITGTVSQSNVITESINFFDTNDPGSSDYYDVVFIAGDTSSAYLTAASDGGVLTGGAGSEEITITGVPEYELYR